MKKTIMPSLLAFSLLIVGGTQAFAVDTVSVERIPSSVIAIWEDVPVLEAVQDASYCYTLSQAAQAAASGVSTRSSTAVTWNVWGEEDYDSYHNLYKPIGHSEQKNGSTVLSTYHYTRTFYGRNILGIVTDYRGDSGRVWGNYTVTAEGTWCISDIPATMTHYVYYGTES
jgi:hypothetical protein